MNGRSFVNRVLPHLLFWLGAWTFTSMQMYSWSSDLRRTVFVNTANMPVCVMISYFNLYFLLPRYLLAKKYITYAILVSLSLLFFGFCQRLVVHFVIMPVYPEGISKEFFGFNIQFWDTINMWSILALTCAAKLLRSWYKGQRRTEELQREKLQSELKYLKTQIHPHFFFNTLNNLYALTLIKSDDAPGVVLKLSGLMDYLLYESNAPYVTLSKEMEHIENYLALEKLRFGKRLNLQFTVEGDIDEKYIAPMLILPFIENSFKHGVRDSIKNGWVVIDIKIEEDELFLCVENSQWPEEESAKEKDRIGLKNVKRRLELIYPDNYDMTIINVSHSFKVALRLNLLYKTIPYENEVLDY